MIGNDIDYSVCESRDNMTAGPNVPFGAAAGRATKDVRAECGKRRKAVGQAGRTCLWSSSGSPTPRKTHSLALVFAILSATVVFSHGQPGAPPELERLAWMIGDWNTVAKYKLVPEGPVLGAGSTQTVRWAFNKQFIISEQGGLMPYGWRAKLIITAWDVKGQRYKMIDVDLTGAVTELSMAIDGDTQTVLYYPTLGGHRIRTELKINHVSDVEYTTRGECTDLDRTWICYDSVSKKKSAGVTN